MSYFEPSPFQQAIFQEVLDGTTDILVNAVAGSGKTTTLLKIAEIASRGSVGIFAFNTKIKKEIAEKLAKAGLNHVACQTLHSLGLATLKYHLKKIKDVDDKKYADVADWYFKEDQHMADYGQLLSPTVTALRYARESLINPRDRGQFHDMCNHFGLSEVFDEFETIFRAIAPILERGKEIAETKGIIDFTDMIYLPVAMSLRPKQLDLLMVDECQDLSKAKLELVLMARRPGGRIIFCGDRKQAIYGFAGADSNSVANILERTNAKELPLSFCYRCPANVIVYAQQWCPEIQSPPNAKNGILERILSDKVEDMVEIGDYVICRTNAPLIGLAFKLIRAGKPASVLGRDIGKNLEVFIKPLLTRKSSFNMEGFAMWVMTERDKQVDRLSRRENTEGAIAAVMDKADTLIAIYDGLCDQGNPPQTPRDIIDWINSLFTDEEGRVITLCTIHKSKGLEANRIFILYPEDIPHPMARKDWQIGQEYNLAYVAHTRALQALYLAHSKLNPEEIGPVKSKAEQEQEDREKAAIEMMKITSGLFN